MRYLANRPSNLYGDFDRALNNLFDNNRTAAGRTPNVDIIADDKAYVLEVELPGLSEKEVDVKVEDNKIVISSAAEEPKGKEPKEKEPDKTEAGKYILRERSRRPFTRTFLLPKDADAESISGSFSNGVLTIRIEKSPEKQPRSIKIKAA